MLAYRQLEWKRELGHMRAKEEQKLFVLQDRLQNLQRAEEELSVAQSLARGSMSEIDVRNALDAEIITSRLERTGSVMGVKTR